MLLIKELIAMRIIPYEGESNLEDIESLSIVIKSVPFENSYVPAFFIQSPGDDYPMTIDEMNALMDGVEIARSSLDHIINYLLRESFTKEDRKKEEGDF